MNLKEKLHKIYDAIDAIEKRGHNKSQSYNYIKAADVTNAIRKQFIDLKVYAEINFDFVGPAYTIARAKDKDAPFSAVNVKCSIVFHDLDSDETRTSSGLGSGADGGDKAAYKAQTGALKYALKNAFLVPDEADPEADESVDAGSKRFQDDPPDFQEARHAAPKTEAPQNTKKAENHPAGPPAAEVEGLTAPPPQAAPALDPPAGRDPGDEDDNTLPTEKELKDYRGQFKTLGDDLSTDGKLKSSKGLPINRKLLVFLLSVTKASDPKNITKAQWDDFFVRVEKAKGLETGLVGLAKLVNKANGIEDKK